MIRGCVHGVALIVRTFWQTRKNSESIEIGSFNGERKHRTHAEFNLYTDGSKTGDGVGAGAALYRNNEMVRDGLCTLPPNASLYG